MKKYKRLYVFDTEATKYKKNIDRVIGKAIEEFKLYINETKYMNNSQEELIIIDKEWKEAIYQELYKRVIKELKINKLLKEGD